MKRDNLRVLPNFIRSLLNAKTSLNNFEVELISSFFRDQTNVALLISVLQNCSEENRRKIGQEFQRYIFHVRFVSYISSLIRYANIDYHRKRKKIEERNQLIFDTPIKEESEISLGEYLLSNSYVPSNSATFNSESFLSSIENCDLSEAFSRLTERQKYVITLAYSVCERDTEIASRLQVSQQAVTKTKKAAIKQLKKSLQRNLSAKTKRKGVV